MRLRLASSLIIYAMGSALAAQQPASAGSTAAGAAAALQYVGRWNGTLVAGPTRFRMALVISDSSGRLQGTMLAVDQAGVKAPALVSTSSDTLRFSVEESHITYIGVLAPTRDSVVGTFRQNGAAIPLTLTRSAADVQPDRPQTPQPPFPYRTEDIEVQSAPGVRLAGTLVVPAGPGPFAAVVLVAGSGRMDRDETILDHRPLLVIADYLARHGIASIRYDDRGVGKSTGSFENATTAAFADDAEAAVRYLQRTQGIASNRVGILGHSEGGLVGPMVAARNNAVAFLVLMAGPGLRGDSVAFMQMRLLAKLTGASGDLADRQIKNRRRLAEAIADARDSVDAVRRLAQAKSDMLQEFPETERAAAGQRVDQASVELLSPWMRYFLHYDPRTALRQVHVPVLAMGGALDVQVPAEPNLTEIDAALRTAGNRNYQIVQFPGLNHLFQTATTGSPTEYATIRETIAPAVLDTIASFVNRRFETRAP